LGGIYFDAVNLAGQWFVFGFTALADQRGPKGS